MNFEIVFKQSAHICPKFMVYPRSLQVRAQTTMLIATTHITPTHFGYVHIQQVHACNEQNLYLLKPLLYWPRHTKNNW